VLAGPAPSPAEEALVRQALSELGDRLEWRGAVHGDAKLRFFRDIDVFVFPTRYPYEAQPNVVLEALSAGNHVVAPDRGCIREDLERLGGTCVPREHEATVEIWTDILAGLLRDPDALMRARAESSRTVRAATGIARKNYEGLLHTIAFGRRPDDLANRA
jgi:glycosyltransferase involved in cell wall biosynthesis